eukprot:5707782-Amphidinium_carterae.2
MVVHFARNAGHALMNQFGSTLVQCPCSCEGDLQEGSQNACFQPDTTPLVPVLSMVGLWIVLLGFRVFNCARDCLTRQILQPSSA